MKISRQSLFNFSIGAIILVFLLIVLKSHQQVKAQNQIKVFPALYEIENSQKIGWENPLASLSLDLSSDAPFESFNKDNSAFLYQIKEEEIKQEGNEENQEEENKENQENFENLNSPLPFEENNPSPPIENSTSTPEITTSTPEITTSTPEITTPSSSNETTTPPFEENTSLLEENTTTTLENSSSGENNVDNEINSSPQTDTFENINNNPSSSENNNSSSPSDKESTSSDPISFFLLLPL